MARLGGMSSETFSSPSAGLGSILRDQKVIPGFRSSRASVILGIVRPPVAQSVSVSSSPVESFLLDANTGADEADELKEEDIWGMEDATEGISSGPDFGNLRMSTADESTPKQRASWVMEELGLGVGSPRVNAAEVLVSSRRREKGFGVADAFVNGGSMGLSPLSRTSEKSVLSGRGRIPRRPSASRMIPLSGGSSKDSSRRHAEGQSAPVEVPKWSKMMGQYVKGLYLFWLDCLLVLRVSENAWKIIAFI
eukprot:c20478_g1_i2 orf=190-942(-)